MGSAAANTALNKVRELERVVARLINRSALLEAKEKPMAKPIRERIREAIINHGDCGFIGYYKLARLVFPKDDFPRAFGSPTRGGPPGCYMVLSRAIREHKFSMIFSDDPKAGVVHSTVGLGKSGMKRED